MKKEGVKVKIRSARSVYAELKKLQKIPWEMLSEYGRGYYNALLRVLIFED